MKVIDEKGRLFGKINIIDFLVIIFLLSLTPMFYFGYKISKQKGIEIKAQEQQPTPKEFIKITINCKFVKLRPKVLEIISRGDKELDSNGNLIGEIVSLGAISPYVHKLNVGLDQKLIQEDSELKQATVTLKINAKVDGQKIYYKDKQILIGSTLEFSTGKYSVEIEDTAIVKDNAGILENINIESGKYDILMMDKISELESKLSGLETKITRLEEKINLLKPNNKKSQR